MHLELPLPVPGELAELRARVQQERARFAELTRAFAALEPTFCEPARADRASRSRPAEPASRTERNLAGWVEAHRASIVTHGSRIHELLRELAGAEEAHAKTYERLYARAVNLGQSHIAHRARAIGANIYRAGARAEEEARRLGEQLASATVAAPPSATTSQVIARAERLDAVAKTIVV